MWYVFAERKSRIPGKQDKVVSVKLKARKGKTEAGHMAGHLTGHGWVASIGEEV